MTFRPLRYSMEDNMNLPSQPTLAEFTVCNTVFEKQYVDALAAWERVCKMLIEANERPNDEVIYCPRCKSVAEGIAGHYKCTSCGCGQEFR